MMWDKEPVDELYTANRTTPKQMCAEDALIVWEMQTQNIKLGSLDLSLLVSFSKQNTQHIAKTLLLYC